MSLLPLRTNPKVTQKVRLVLVVFRVFLCVVLRVSAALR